MFIFSAQYIIQAIFIAVYLVTRIRAAIIISMFIAFYLCTIELIQLKAAGPKKYFRRVSNCLELSGNMMVMVLPFCGHVENFEIIMAALIFG